MSSQDRIKKIVNYVWNNGSISTKEALNLCGASIASIRRDLNKIDQDYSDIERFHGGLRLALKDKSEEIYFNTRLNINYTEKIEIAHKAIEYIHDGDYIYIDSGSTCLEFASRLPSKFKLKVITGDIKIANQLANSSNIELHVVGGLVRNHYFSIGGALTVDFLNNFTLTKVFMSCDAISVKYGITNSSVFEVDIKKVLFAKASDIFLMIDSSKFEKIAPYYVSDVKAVKRIITDHNVSETYKNLYLENGIEII